MLTFDQFTIALADPVQRTEHGLDLPQLAVTTLLADNAKAAAFYDQWTNNGQPKLGAAAPAPTGFFQTPGVTKIFIGVGLALLGIIITAVTYAAAASGGTYFVTWGLILVGGIQAVSGVVTFVKSRSAQSQPVAPPSGPAHPSGPAAPPAPPAPPQS